MDKEYLILQNIDQDSNITQRQLSKKTGLSLGTINILINKMVKEGLVKIERIPSDRVLYMLTPKGIFEKLNKTVEYIKIHYQHLNSVKETIKSFLLELSARGDRIYVLLGNDEVSNLARSAISEMNNSRIIETENVPSEERSVIVVLDNEKYINLKDADKKVYNLLDKL